VNAAEIEAMLRRSWCPWYGQVVTEEYIVNCFPKWMADVASEVGELEVTRCVVWL
jgi:hypothetical protein